MADFTISSYPEFDVPRQYGFPVVAEDIIQRPNDEYVFVRQGRTVPLDRGANDSELQHPSRDDVFYKLTDTPWFVRVRNAVG